MFYSDPDQPSYGKDSSSCEAIFVFKDKSYIISSNVQVAIFNSSVNYNLLKMDFPWEERFTINGYLGHIKR